MTARCIISCAEWGGHGGALGRRAVRGGSAVNAAAVQRLGIGIVVEEETLSPQTIRHAVDVLRQPASLHRQRLQVLCEEWRALPGPDKAAEAVIALVDHGGV